MRKADNLPPSCAVVTKSGGLNFLEPSGPVQACNGTAVPFYIKEDETRGTSSTGVSDQQISYLQSTTFTYFYTVCRLRIKYLIILSQM